MLLYDTASPSLLTVMEIGTQKKQLINSVEMIQQLLVFLTEPSIFFLL